MEEFVRYLADRAMPLTRQRRLVAEVVLSATDHPSAEAIHRLLRGRDEPIGAATVYRSLEVMVESGLVREHDFGEGYKRYEAAGARGVHEHLLCQRCSRVVEFANDRLERMLHLIAEEHGFRADRHRVEIHGLCAECRNRDLEALETAGPKR